MTQQDLQRKLGMLNEKYLAEFTAAQNKFFLEHIVQVPESSELLRYRQFGMIHTNEASLNISLNDWVYLFQAPVSEDGYTLKQLSTLAGAWERLVMKDWLTTYPYNPGEGSPLKDWVDFRAYLVSLNQLINPVIDDFTEGLLDKLLRTQHLDISGQSYSLPKPNPLVDKAKAR